MWWLIFWLSIGLSIAIAVLILRRRWITPWAEVEQLVRQIGRGERPPTFLLVGSRQAERVGVALEDTFIRQQELDRQLDQHVAGQKAIFAAMHDPLLVIDAQRHLVLFNRAAHELFSIDQSSLGAPLLDALRDPMIDEAVGKGLHEGKMSRREMFLGDRHWQVTSMPMQDDSGVATGAVVYFHDITELKRAEEMRRDFVASVSHELRTPLSILRGYIETLLHDPKTHNGQTADILRVMEKHSNRLQALIEDLLTLAKLESRTPELRLEKIDFEPFLSRMISEWEKKFREKNLNVALEVAADVPPISADEFRLEQLFANLLDNALKYSRRGGEVRLRAEKRDREVALSVSDNGIGISKEDLTRIFERFYRADKGRSREHGGTGLGLSIVKHIAQLHGGTVEAESEPGNGTTVRVMLPIQNDQAANNE
ncbi:MAG TPA: ATP-binding protein [Candidatus Udaeobacter sp.]|nr:ATP-binding protein [Candidatus Udaeobacter sp.]